MEHNEIAASSSELDLEAELDHNASEPVEEARVTGNHNEIVVADRA